MSEHVHEWAFSSNHYAQDVSWIIAVVKFKVCGLERGPEWMEHRLNATERLSPHLMGSLAYDRKLEKHWRKAFAEYAQAMYGDDYQMPDEFAAALEGGDVTRAAKENQ